MSTPVDQPAEAGVSGWLVDLFASMHAGVYATDVAGRVVLINSEALRLLGWTGHDLRGVQMHELVHSRTAEGTPMPVDSCALLGVSRTGTPAAAEDDVFWRADDTPLPVSWSSAPMVRGGRITGAVVVFTDASAIHDRAVAQQGLAAANARLTLLTDVSEALSVLDPVEAVRRLTDVVVGDFCDRCAIELTGPAGPSVTVPAPSAPDRDCAAHSITTPLLARRVVLGGMTWSRTDPDRPFTAQDEALAVEIGRRAGLALDNARLFGEQRQVAETLQRTLLTVLPESPELELTARYLPATAGIEVGGDWYDAFVLPDGSMILVIGDIVGHDLPAAGRMGQVRNVLRGIAWGRDEPPSGLLHRLDEAVLGLRVGALATCLIARVGPVVGDGEPPGRYRVVWSAAGHPPPAVVRADGSATLLSSPPDLMLGVEIGHPRHDHTVDLFPGDTVWLFTDGLVERADHPFDAGLVRLQPALGASAGIDLDAACDVLLDRLVGAGHPDDVAVLALRLREH